LKKQVKNPYLLALIILAIVGAWLRVRHLGQLSLIGDEGIQALAVQGILEHGVPKVDSGLIYGRMPLYLYMQAAFAYFFGVEAFWLRLPSVIWGVVAIVPAYILGRDIFSRPVGLVTAAIMAFSVWEIELSRYARAYTLFQCFFLIALICFYRGFMLDRRKYKVWFLAVSFLATLTHAFSDILITLFLIPLFSLAFSRSRKMQFSLWGVGLAGMLIVRREITGFHLPKSLSFPSGKEATELDIIDQIRRLFGLPALNLPEMSYFFEITRKDPFIIAVFALVVGVATAFLCYKLYQKKQGWRILVALLMVWAAFAYQFGLVMIFLVVYLAISARDFQRLHDPISVVVFGAVSICMIGWFAALSVKYPQLNSILVAQTLFAFPDFYGFFLSWLIDGWPVMTATLVVGSSVMFALYMRDRRNIEYIFLLGSLYIPAIFMSFFESYQESRYIFHFYPIVSVVFSWVIIKAGLYVKSRFISRRDYSWKSYSRRFMAGLGLLVVLLISQDANPWRAWSVSERTYQSARDPYRSVLSWDPYAGFHQDHERPSQFVKERIKEEDKVVVIGIGYMESLYHFYIGRTDYFLTPTDDPDVSTLVDQQRGRIHYITGSNIITGIAQLKALVQKHELWILGDRRIFRRDNRRYSEEMKDFLSSFVHEEDYIGRDGITFATKIR